MSGEARGAGEGSEARHSNEDRMEKRIGVIGGSQERVQQAEEPVGERLVPLLLLLVHPHQLRIRPRFLSNRFSMHRIYLLL